MDDDEHIALIRNYSADYETQMKDIEHMIPTFPTIEYDPNMTNFRHRPYIYGDKKLDEDANSIMVDMNTSEHAIKKVFWAVVFNKVFNCYWGTI